MPLFAPFDRAFAPLPKAQRIDWLEGCTFAHRGLHGAGLAENSLAAFEAAVARGYGIELDVQLSQDGVPMVFHDWDLDRMTTQRGPLSARSADQLGEIALSGGGGTIPTLAQVLDTVAGKAPLLVEVKSRRETDVPALCKAVHSVLEQYRGPFAVIGFDPRVLRWFSRHAPAITRGLSFTGYERSLADALKRRFALWGARPDFLTYDITRLPNPFASGQRQRGLKLVAWTIADAATLAHGLECADALICEGAGFP